MKRPLLALAPLLSLGLSWSLATGCATDPAPEEAPDTGVTPPLDAAKDSTTDSRPDPADSAPRDSAIPDSARPDAGDARVDASALDSGIVASPGEPFDPLAPKPGDPCPATVAEFQTLTRRCGKCGTQSALCDTGRIVAPYGPCTNEKAGEDVCTPNQVEVGVECGLCGSQVRRCDTACLWSTGTCLGEVANGCVKNEVTYLEGICPTIEQTRKQTCSSACMRGAPEVCAAQSPDVVVAPQVANGVITKVYSLSVARTMPRLNSGTCPVASSTINVGYHYARVDNPGADSVNVTVTHGAPPTGTKPNTYIATYLGLAAPPVDAAARQSCTGVVRDSPESQTFVIPPGQSAYVLSTGAAATTAGRFELEVRTNFVGPETPPRIDHMVTIGANAADVVTQPVQFVATQVDTRVATFAACPTTLTTLATYAYRYLRLVNPTAAAKTVDLGGDEPTDTVVAVYPGPDAPISTDRTACIGTTNNTCSNTSYDSCALGVTIPANGSVVVFFGMNLSASYPAATFRVTTLN